MLLSVTLCSICNQNDNGVVKSTNQFLRYKYTNIYMLQ